MSLDIKIHEAAESAFPGVLAFCSLDVSTKAYHAEVWGALHRMGIEPSQVCPETGEDWEYMGTELHVGSDREERWMHSFRHRSRPPHGTREYVYAPASEDMNLVLRMERDTQLGRP
jgi:hypothetical protein